MRNHLFCAVLAGTVLLAIAPSGLPAQGIDVGHMDRKVAPGNDFYQYANGRWLARARIPSDRSAVNAFTELTATTYGRSRKLVEAAEDSHPAPGTGAYRVAAFYRAMMDTGAIDRAGMAPLQPELKEIAAIHSREDLARVLGETLRADVDPLNNTNFHTPNLFGLWVASGFHDPRRNIPYLLQGGLELPNRSYYLDASPAMHALRVAYRKHIAAMLRLEGFSGVRARAAQVYSLEHAIAEDQVSLADSENVHKADQLWTVSEFATKAPGLDWHVYFQAAGLGAVRQFDVWQPPAFTGDAHLVATEPLAAWKNWLAYHLIEDNAEVLPKPVRREDFDFFGKVVKGTRRQPPRWQLAIHALNEWLGDALGRMYVARYFPASAKAKAQAMVANLLQVYRERLAKVSWLAPSTKAEAERKLAAIYVGIGYPEHWRSYAGLTVKPGDAFGNLQRARLFRYRANVAELGRPVNRHAWHMEPQTVNAVNLPLQDAIDFPAAILQPPFFDPGAPVAVNYGAVGAVIGHEISHTFDTTGSLFDAEGRLRNWWTPADVAHFHALAARLERQVSAYHPLPGVAVNGRQTIDEDIADVAGLAAAYQAYHAALGGKPGPVEHGFTADQQFYIAFAQIWAGKQRPQALRQQLLTDSHAPGRYRADTVRNEDAWYRAFAVKPGDALYLPPDQRIRIW